MQEILGVEGGGQWRWRVSGKRGPGRSVDGGRNFSITEVDGVSSSWVRRHGESPPPFHDDKSRQFGKQDGLSKYGKNVTIINNH